MLLFSITEELSCTLQGGEINIDDAGAALAVQLVQFGPDHF